MSTDVNQRLVKVVQKNIFIYIYKERKESIAKKQKETYLSLNTWYDFDVFHFKGDHRAFFQ